MSIFFNYRLLFFTFLALSFTPSLAQNGTASCPLDFSVLRKLIGDSKPTGILPSQECQYAKLSLRLVLSYYLQRSNSFLPPLDSAESCWRAYQDVVDEFRPNFDIRSSCGFNTSWISQGCMDITTRSQFESLVPKSSLSDVVSNCNQSLENNSPCATCTASLSKQQASYLTGKSVGNLSDCQAYPSIYAAAFANRYGPTDRGTAKCLFLLDFVPKKSGRKKKKVLIWLIPILGVGLLIVIGGCWFWRRRYEGLRRKKKRDRIGRGVEMNLSSGLESISGSTTLVEYKFDEIKKATRNFSRDNIIGRGGYGNVYKGELPDGSQVAMKRFKNLSASGDASFIHELEKEKLSWPVRQKIALGTARGLAYLHYGAQPGIIHRDIKASNILLDERFEAKVADFGLAKFAPEGATHLSTRVAGTMGYVAPEYALYGQLTERSDVYSFGVVLLELLSGKKALGVSEESQPALVTDWAWSLVRKGRTLDVIEDGMPELGPQDILEKYVLIAVLCSHPQLYARPTMDQVVKMLETDQSIPAIPERPIPLVAEMDDIERSVSSSWSGHLSSPAGYRTYMLENDHPSSHNEARSSSSHNEARSSSSHNEARPSLESRPVELL
ncbi:hypothetical protein GH714_024410 [Hevea brasiliensis]|uniref:non-specific serine/threonine protein kinase n=1 Tax=Hevea brasiliensis TaxID=3981 RepID=A0A6A6LF57_HEVBR|nr:hypothetical protein GH714_024410 [Hevea brasiliensis]